MIFTLEFPGVFWIEKNNLLFNSFVLKEMKKELIILIKYNQTQWLCELKNQSKVKSFSLSHRLFEGIGNLYLFAFQKSNIKEDQLHWELQSN